MDDVQEVVTITPPEGTLSIDSHQDRRLGGLQPPMCQSCQRNPAIISRRFSTGEIFLICWSCR